MKMFHIITFILVIVGGLNWLSIGLLDWGIGDFLTASVARVVYILVGLSACISQERLQNVRRLNVVL